MKNSKIRVMIGFCCLVVGVICVMGFVLAMNQPKTASSLLTRSYTVMSNADNMHMSGKASVNINMGDSLNVPVILTLDGNVDNKSKTVNGNITLTSDMFGQSTSSSMKLYGEHLGADNMDLHVKMPDSDWECVAQKTHQKQMVVIQEFIELLRDDFADIVTLETADNTTLDYDGAYYLTCDVKSLLNNQEIRKWFDDNKSLFSLDSVSIDNVIDLCGTSKLHIVFDNKYRLVGVYINDMTYDNVHDMSGLMGEGSENTNVSITANVSVIFDEFNQVSADLLAKPSDIQHD